MSKCPSNKVLYTRREERAIEGKRGSESGEATSVQSGVAQIQASARALSSVSGRELRAPDYLQNLENDPLRRATHQKSDETMAGRAACGQPFGSGRPPRRPFPPGSRPVRTSLARLEHVHDPPKLALQELQPP